MSLEALVVGLFAILPGFVSGGVRSMFVHSESTSTAAWTLTSVLRSLFLNAVALAISIPRMQSLNLDLELAEISTKIDELSGSSLVGYVVLLFGLAVLWGLLTGLFPKFAPHSIAYARRLTPISPAPDVLHLVLGSHFRSKENLKRDRDSDQVVPWLKFESGGRKLFGRLKNTSVRIELDKPFEAFLEPIYEVAEDGSLSRLRLQSTDPGATLLGLYLKISPAHILEVYSARADWTPSEAAIDSEGPGDS